MSDRVIEVSWLHVAIFAISFSVLIAAAVGIATGYQLNNLKKEATHAE